MSPDEKDTKPVQRTAKAKPQGTVTNKPVSTADTPDNLQFGGQLTATKEGAPNVDVLRQAQTDPESIVEEEKGKVTPGQTFAEGVTGALEAIYMALTAPEATQRQVAHERLFQYLRETKGHAPKVGLTEEEVPYQLQERVVNPSPVQSVINREQGYTPAASPETERNQRIAEVRTEVIAGQKRLAELERPVTRIRAERRTRTA